jgi:group I intron endonuclease
MTDVAHLYRLTSPSGKVYIGITKNVRKRWLEHSHAARCGSKCALHHAIRKYGFESFKKEVLVKSYFNYIKDLEIKAIEMYSTMIPHGYNMTAGGDGTIGYVFTKEDRQRKSLALKGRVFSDELKRKLSFAHKGKKMPEEQKQKIRATLKSIVRSPEWGGNISKAKKGVPQTEEMRKARSEKQRKKWLDPEYKARQLELQRLGSERKRQRSLLHAV